MRVFVVVVMGKNEVAIEAVRHDPRFGWAVVNDDDSVWWVPEELVLHVDVEGVTIASMEADLAEAAA